MRRHEARSAHPFSMLSGSLRPANRDGSHWSLDIMCLLVWGVAKAPANRGAPKAHTIPAQPDGLGHSGRAMPKR